MVIMILSLVVFSTLLFHYSPLIFMLFIAMSAMEILWSTAFLNKRKTIDYALFTNMAENRNHAYELTNGMADLKVNNAEKARIGKWKETQDTINRISFTSSLVNMAQGGGQNIIVRLKDLTVTGIAALLVINGEMTLGTMMTLGYITGGWRSLQHPELVDKLAPECPALFSAYRRRDQRRHRRPRQPPFLHPHYRAPQCMV